MPSSCGVGEDKTAEGWNIGNGLELCIRLVGSKGLEAVSIVCCESEIALVSVEAQTQSDIGDVEAKIECT